MEAIAALIFGGLVLMGLACALFLVAIQPIWGIVDVAVSKEHSGGTKALVIILTLILLGPIMTFCYACFGTRSRALRRATLTSFVVLLLSGLTAFTVALAVPATKNVLGTVASDASETSVEHPASPTSSAGLPAGEVKPFTALHQVRTSESRWFVSVAQFSGQGPDAASTIPLVLPSIYPISHLAVDASGPAYYAITTHKVGRIIPATGRFIEFETDPAIGKPSWPSALAFDSKQGLLLIAARSTGYSYDPATGEWKALPGLEDKDLVALEYVADKGILYGLRSRPGGGVVTKLVKMTPNGATLQETDLSVPIPVDTYPHPMAQLCGAGDQLIVVASPSARRGSPQATSSSHPALFSVDPESGICLPIETQIASKVD